MTPSKALYGYKPPAFSFIAMEFNTPNVREFTWERERVQSLLKEALIQAQSRMKFYADSKRTEREFTVGDWVYLRLQPYRQATEALCRNLKLAPRFFGQFQVLARIGSVAYRLQLPPSS